MKVLSSSTPAKLISIALVLGLATTRGPASGTAWFDELSLVEVVQHGNQMNEAPASAAGMWFHGDNLPTQLSETRRH